MTFQISETSSTKVPSPEREVPEDDGAAERERAERERELERERERVETVPKKEVQDSRAKAALVTAVKAESKRRRNAVEQPSPGAEDSKSPSCVPYI